MLMGENPVLFEELFPFKLPPRFSTKALKHEIRITDTTLRDGQQGWRPFTVEESLKIYELLHELSGPRGVVYSSEMFLYTNKDREIARRIKDLGYDYPKPIAWIRATFNDLKLVWEAKFDEAVILTSVSDYHIYYKLRLDRRRAEEKFLSVIEKALKSGLTVRTTLEDITRSDIYGFVIPFVRKVLRLAEKYGSKVIIKVADTLGVGLPFENAPLPRSIPKIIRALIEDAGVPGSQIEFHGHNDFHLVVANHLAAWLAGASLSNCTLLGIGERAGNCPLEAMALLYVQLKGTTDGMNLKVLPKIKKFFEEIGYYVPEFQPIVGANAFRTKAGIHIDGLMKNPQVYLPYDPNAVLGVPYTIAITPYSGRAGIMYWLTSVFGSNGWISLKNDPRLNKLYEEILEIFKTGRTMPLTDIEMFMLVKKHIPEIVEKYRSRLPAHLRGLVENVRTNNG